MAADHGRPHAPLVGRVERARMGRIGQQDHVVPQAAGVVRQVAVVVAQRFAPPADPGLNQRVLDAADRAPAGAAGARAGSRPGRSGRADRGQSDVSHSRNPCSQRRQ